MRITCADFICCGYYSISDLKDYFHQMKIKNDRENKVLMELNDPSSRINTIMKETIKSYEALLSGIDKNRHPDLYLVITEGLNHLKKITSK